ncbi:hypothetical protein Mal15_14170 [Stieleria maiorica]|uniref:Uncharacterized protein n=1 Tax=Stieleria maiorica TaxID=2795974 RepID=A0A5B9MDP4_9BACT|nr:hypothetical protein Mal15_14170 [Stieleria maiorica]
MMALASGTLIGFDFVFIACFLWVGCVNQVHLVLFDFVRRNDVLVRNEFADQDCYPLCDSFGLFVTPKSEEAFSTR